jgi:Novel AID APOBEC clade 1
MPAALGPPAVVDHPRHLGTPAKPYGTPTLQPKPLPRFHSAASQPPQFPAPAPQPFFSNAPIQRKINWERLKDREILDTNALVTALMEKFGAHNKAHIEQQLALIEEHHEMWGWQNLTDYFARQCREGIISKVDTAMIVSVQGNVPIAACNREDYVYRGVTKLTAVITSAEGQSTTKHLANLNEEVHAEDGLIALIERNEEFCSKSSMRLLINNSPCLRCASRLAPVVKKYGIRMSIYFSKPYCKAHETGGFVGEEDQKVEIVKAIRILRRAGIRVHTVDPESVTYALTPSGSDSYAENLRQVRMRIQKYRKHGQGPEDGYSSDEASDYEL